MSMIICDHDAQLARTRHAGRARAHGFLRLNDFQRDGGRAVRGEICGCGGDAASVCAVVPIMQRGDCVLEENAEDGDACANDGRGGLGGGPDSDIFARVCIDKLAEVS